VADHAPNAGTPQMGRNSPPRTPISRRTENLAPSQRTRSRTAMRNLLRDHPDDWYAIAEIRENLPVALRGELKHFTTNATQMLRRMLGAGEVERRDTTREDHVARGLDPRVGHLWRYREADEARDVVEGYETDQAAFQGDNPYREEGLMPIPAQTIEEARAVYDALMRGGMVPDPDATTAEPMDLMDAWDDVTAAYSAAEGDEFWVVFDGGPGPVGGRFVEVEDGHGNSVRTKAEWKQRGNGMWELGPFVDSVAFPGAPLP